MHSFLKHLIVGVEEEVFPNLADSIISNLLLTVGCITGVVILVALLSFAMYRVGKDSRQAEVEELREQVKRLERREDEP